MPIKKQLKIEPDRIIVAKKEIVFTEEKDNWGILYDPETDFSFGVNPVSVLIWKMIQENHSIKDIVSIVQVKCTNVPGNVEEHVILFIEKLLAKGLATVTAA